MTSKIDLKAIKKRCKEATAEPWKRRGKYSINGPVDPDDSWRQKAPYNGKPYTIVKVRANQNYRKAKRDEANAAFIENARQDLPACVALLEEAAEALSCCVVAGLCTSTSDECECAICYAMEVLDKIRGE